MRKTKRASLHVPQAYFRCVFLQHLKTQGTCAEDPVNQLFMNASSLSLSHSFHNYGKLKKLATIPIA